MRTLHTITAVIVTAVVGLPASGHAHVTLETQQAVANSYYKGVFRVPHGCAGSATTAVRIKIPDGITAAKPQPKTGWQLTTVKGPLKTPISDGHGGQITEGVVEVLWTGGKLLDEHYDEFVIRMKLPATSDVTVPFPVVQECESGVTRWIEVPEAGKDAHDLKHPAPILKLGRPQGNH